MNEAHLHLLFNHLPIIVPILGVLIMLAGILLKSAVIRRTAFAVFILGALMTVPAYLSGEGAEEIVEHYPGVNHRLVHQHADLASTFIWFSYGLGLLSLVGLWANWKKKGFANILSYVTLVFAGVVIYFAQQTGNSGGEIRHPEIIQNVNPDWDED
jgi:uncharacterized membrane protein